MKRVTVCSDDFGQNEAISQGILQLVKNSRLQAVTAFTQAPGWKLDGPALLEFSETIDIGIHLNLTEPFPDESDVFSLNSLLIKAHLGLMKKDLIKARFKKQIDAFIQVAHRLPDFLDGHQHIHAFPIICEALYEVIEEYWPKNPRLYVRDSSKVSLNYDGFLIKKLVLHFSCMQLAGKLKKLNAPSPGSFYGVYDFDSQANLAQLFNDWFAQCPDGSLIMCHPALPGGDDAIQTAREHELTYLNSVEFLQACQAHGVTLSPYKNYLFTNT